MTRYFLMAYLAVFSPSIFAKEQAKAKHYESDLVESEATPLVLISEVRNYSNMSEYDVRAAGDDFMVTVGSTGQSGQITVYDRDGSVVVGVRYSNNQVLIHDHSGVVAFGSLDDVDASIFGDYGSVTRRLTDPHFIADLMRASAKGTKSEREVSLPWASLLSSRFAGLFSAQAV